MTIKKRIFISNTVMVLISLLILFGIFESVFELFKDEYMNGIGLRKELADHVYEVQTLLIEEQKSPSTWEELGEKMYEYGFKLYVADEEQKVYFSNVGHKEKEYIKGWEHSEFTDGQVKLYSIEDVTVVRCIVTKDGMDYHVYAANKPQKGSFLGMDRSMFEVFVIVFFITGLIAITALLLGTQLYTRLLIKRIMRPVEELKLAADRIGDGNLDMPVLYKEPDEFLEVCDTFNTMQEHLKEGIEKNAAYEKARTEMISGISHDLRTPLTSVKAFIKGILDGVAATPEKQKQYLTIAYQKACDMEALLQKLFFFSKLETGNLPFYMQRVEIGKWMEKYVTEKQLEGQAKGYVIFLQSEVSGCFADIDDEQMKRVFNNLVENSLKYAAVDNLEINVRISKETEKIILTFSDNGMGIDAEKLPHVFEQFYRGDEARNSKNDGSGLGLYVCKYIVEEHGGRITAENQDGFSVEIELPEEEE